MGGATSESPAAYAVVSDSGPTRELNEDCALATVLPMPADGRGQPVLLAVVADGMGGHAAGEVASQLAIAHLAEGVTATLSGTVQYTDQLIAALEIGFQRANEEVYRQGGALRNNMGTTLTAVLLQGCRMCIGHVGDSRVYHWHDGQLTRLTRDHSLAGDMLGHGLLTPEEAAQSTKRHQLTRAIGPRETALADLTWADLATGDRILLATDGLYDSLTDTDLTHLLGQRKPAQRLCQDLVSIAQARDGSDNLTAVCLDVGAAMASSPVARRACRPLLQTRAPALAMLLVVMFLIALVVRALLLAPTPPPSARGHAATVLPGETYLRLQAKVAQGKLTITCHPQPSGTTVVYGRPERAVLLGTPIAQRPALSDREVTCLVNRKGGSFWWQISQAPSDRSSPRLHFNKDDPPAVVEGRSLGESHGRWSHGERRPWRVGFYLDDDRRETTVALVWGEPPATVQRGSSQDAPRRSAVPPASDHRGRHATVRTSRPNAGDAVHEGTPITPIAGPSAGDHRRPQKLGREPSPTGANDEP